MVLREFTPGDEALLVELDSDPQVMHYITGGLATPAAEIRDEVLPRWLRYYEEQPGFGFWAAELHDGGFLGWLHLRPDAEHGDNEPELGYRLRHEAWGRGLATEGSRALIDHAFSIEHVERVRAETMAVHIASRRVMEKCGMRLVRTFHADWPYRIPGDEAGDVEYVIERGDWAGPGPG
jgi:RimJ/RimL family protein N-acetyltransferase